MKVQITGASNFVNRMFEAAGTFQWARELLKNSIEAGAHRVEFGIEWEAVRKNGVYRRTVADDGRGMGPDELLAFFSTLGLSGKKIKGVHENYGVGAKIATLPWNPQGVVVCSYKGGKGHMIWIMLNQRLGDYELVEFDIPGGRKRVVIEPMEVEGVDWSKVRPSWMTDHGTVVTLLGDKANPNTAAGHLLAGGTDLRGLALYLNSRFWDLAGVDVRVAELRAGARDRWPRGPEDQNDSTRVNRRRIQGARHYAETPSERGQAKKGVVELADGRVHAHWVLWEGPKPAVHTYAREQGYMAVRYQGELYGLTTNKAHFRWFGVAESDVQQRLTIVVEPQPLKDKWGVYPDSSRNRLMFAGDGARGEELPLSTWAYEFAEKLPEPIREAIRAARGAGPTAGEIDPEYRRRLQERFGNRWTKKVVVAAGPEDPVVGTMGREAAPEARGEGAGLLGGEGEDPVTTKPAAPARRELIDKGKEHGAEKGRGVDIPRYRLAHKEDFTEAWYLAAWAPHEADGPTVLVNVDSPILEEMVKYRQGMYPEVYAEDVAQEVRRAIGEIASCKVAHIQRLAAVVPEEVLDRDFRNERALTAGLMGLIAEEALIAARLRGKFRARAA